MIKQFQESLRNNTLIGNHRFKIIKTIGQGGFGFTYLAVDSNLKKYAIKGFFIGRHFIRDRDEITVLCLPNYNKNKERFYRKMFLNEAIVLNELSHPNIITSFELFEENNTYYNVMPYIRYYLNLQGIFNQNDKITFLDFQDWNKKANFVSGQKKRRLRDKADAILRGGYVVPSFCPLLSFWGTKEAPASRISDLDACVGIHL